jgi:hypothetical protein
MKHIFKRLFQKLALKVYRMANQNKSSIPKNEYETECAAICKNLIAKKDTALLISPISGKRYIKSDDNQIFIIIEPKQLTIVNHQYSYNIDIWGKPFERISKIFDIEVEKRREKMENEIRSNVKHSLTNIYKNLTYEQI